MEFVRSVETGLRVALVGRHGPDRGREAANDALVYAWQHWDAVRDLDNPSGYLYRLGHRRALRRRLVPRLGSEPVSDMPWYEPRLSPALAGLSARQRQAVMLVEGYQFTFREAAAVLGVAVSSVQTHHERGMARLRAALGADDE